MRCSLGRSTLLALGAAVLAGCGVQAPGQQDTRNASEALPAPALAPAPPPPPVPFSAYAPQRVTVTGSTIAAPAMQKRAPGPGFIVIAPP